MREVTQFNTLPSQPCCCSLSYILHFFCSSCSLLSSVPPARSLDDFTRPVQLALEPMHLELRKAKRVEDGNIFWAICNMKKEDALLATNYSPAQLKFFKKIVRLLVLFCAALIADSRSSFPQLASLYALFLSHSMPPPFVTLLQFEEICKNNAATGQVSLKMVADLKEANVPVEVPLFRLVEKYLSVADRFLEND